MFKDGFHGGRRPRLAAIPLRSLTAAICAVVLLGLSVFVYSPLHRDDPEAGGICPFCAFQHLSAEQAVAPVQIGVVAPIAWWLPPATAVARSCSAPRIHFGRAPPPALLAI